MLGLRADPVDITPGGNLSLDGRAYKIFSAEAISWQDARYYVDVNLPGWHLATVTSPVENAFIWAGIESAWAGQGNVVPQPVLQFWLGGYQASPQAWTWVTGEPWNYTEWSPGEPNGDLGWTGSLTVGRLGVASWNDEGSWQSGIHGFVVESAVPEPGTYGVFASLALMGFAWVNRVSRRTAVERE